MNTYQTLRRLLTERGFLKIDPDNETCRLIGTAEAMRVSLEQENGCHEMTTVFPVFRGLPVFVREVGEEDQLQSVPKVAQLAGSRYQWIDQMIRLGIINADGDREFGQKRKIGYLEAFVATFLVSLRRFGVSLPTLRRAGDAIRDAYHEVAIQSPEGVGCP